MTDTRPTLIVHTVYFGAAGDPSKGPERQAAVELGDALYELLTRPADAPWRHGPGIPVRVATESRHVQLDEASRLVLVPVLGEAALADADERDGAIDQINRWATVLGDHSQVLPLLVNDAWRSHEDRLPENRIRRSLYADSASAVLEVLGSISAALADGPRTPSLYISHAPEDRHETDDAAHRIADSLKTHAATARVFRDICLLSGTQLESQLEDTAPDGLLIVVRSDRSGSYAWCQRELVRAKSQRWPTLVVEILCDGEDRSFPYGGNSPTMRWSRGVSGAEQAPAVARQAIIKTVAWQHHRLEAKRVITAARLPRHNVKVFPRPPELLDIPGLLSRHPGPVLALHPDPEISVHERRVLRGAHPRLRLLTPASSFRGHLGRTVGSPLAGWRVGFSFAESPDVGGPEGTTPQHVGDVVLLLGRSLLSAGAQLGYGSDFRKNSFGEFLMGMIEAYNQTASQPAELLHCYLSADIKKEAGERYEFTAYELGNPTSELVAELGEVIVEAPKADATPLERAFCLSDMRRLMESHVQARILIGSKRRPRLTDDGSDPEGYEGVFPGLVEEAWRALSVGNPLYVIGGFGGGAGLVADLLRNDALFPDILIDTSHGDNPHFEKLRKAFFESSVARELGLPKSLEALGQAVRALGFERLADDRASREWNGLSVLENHVLMESRDPLQITSLVLKGLCNKARGEDPSRRSRSETEARLEIHLIQDYLVNAEGLELVVVPTYEDVPPSEGQAAIDRATGGAVTEAQRRGLRRPSEGDDGRIDAGGRGAARARGERFVPSPSDAMDADYVWAADLGRLDSYTKDRSTAARAATRRMVEAAVQANLRSIGLTTFDGRSPESLRTVALAMVEELLGLGQSAEVFWFEHRTERFEALRAVLEDRAEDRKDFSLSSETRPAAYL
ncbi:MAG: hypothetical protein AAGF23_19170, partial [Acidobacteriota bacterium]